VIRPALAAAVSTTTLIFKSTFNDAKEEDGEEAEVEEEAKAETEGREEAECGEEVNKAFRPPPLTASASITNQELAGRGLRQ
jgi:Sec-independent protein translocase protein TatA